MPGAEQAAELQLPVKPCKQLVTEEPRTRVNKTHNTDRISCTHHHACYLNFIKRERGRKHAKYRTCQEKQGSQAMANQTTWFHLANLLPVARESSSPFTQILLMRLLLPMQQLGKANTFSSTQSDYVQSPSLSHPKCKYLFLEKEYLWPVIFFFCSN